MKKIVSIFFCACLVLTMFGCSKSNYRAIPGLDTSKDATIIIAIPYETNKALNTVANAFMKKYPNVSVRLQYVEDYNENAKKLLEDNEIDMVLNKGATYEYDETTGKSTDDYFYNYLTDTEINFSNTTTDITNNFRYTTQDKDNNEFTYQYSYPLGGETRGVFVNKTLLDQYGLAIPTNYTEFIECCQKLKEAGLVPIQGSPDTQAYGLALAVAAGKVTHDEQALADMAAAKEGISEEFRDIMDKLYYLATLRYTDYKAIEAMGFYTVNNELGQSQSFLGLKTDPETFEVTKPENNYGYVAFMPYLSSTETVIQGLIDEYKLDTEVVFICSPMNDEGTTSPAYITPYYGISINKNSANLIWAREFINFLFQDDVIKTYASEAAIIPNSKDALNVAAKMYNLKPETDITLCGQILFSTSYNGYNPISSAFKDVCKAGASKYMIDLNLDENGNIQYQVDEEGNQFLYLGNGETKIDPKYIGDIDENNPGFAYCSFEYFMEDLESNFEQYRTK